MTATCLLDVNVLVAMMWPAHEAHAKVQHWLSKRGTAHWASCPFTQTAFVRIVSNPVFSPNALTPANALALLRSNLEHAGHQFWKDEIGLGEAIDLLKPKLIGHQQVTDAYLLGLAIHKKGKLATLDRKLPGLLSEAAGERGSIAVL
ncbi:MAG TPA: TA system VapC family ribonuclease toxin [Candidatus Saccharimonadales bacterium]|nr:TA system VapC family ribonuclease toxin [Candidatus Saccharimonadales bacterium]